MLHKDDLMIHEDDLNPLSLTIKMRKALLLLWNNCYAFSEYKLI